MEIAIILLIIFSNLRWSHLVSKANPRSIFKQTGQSIFGGFGLLLNIHIFNYCIKAQLNFVPISFIQLQLIAHYQALKQKGKLLYLSSDFKGSANFLEKTNSNSPVNLFHLNKLSLEALGFLLATWEHRVFITACMLQINPFDQFGVSAGKQIAQKFLEKGQ